MVRDYHLGGRRQEDLDDSRSHLWHLFRVCRNQVDHTGLALVEPPTTEHVAHIISYVLESFSEHL